MASETAIEPPTSTSDMELETTKVEDEVENGVKRDREEEVENGVVSKKQKVENGDEEEKEEVEEEKSVEEVRMETLVEEDEAEEAEDEEAKEEEADRTEKIGPVNVGPKTFATSVEMFDYFYKFLHHWPVNVHANKYEYMVLLDLIKKGHPEPDKKIGSGITAIEIRHHPKWQSRCFFVIRDDKTEEDFSFRKCVDHILPLPENMKVKTDVNKALGGNTHGKKGGGGGRGRGRGGGRGGGHGWGRGGGRSKR